MSASSFESLCTSFCEMAQVAAPTLQAEGEGMLAFNVDWREVTIDVMYEPSRSGHYAFILFQLGPVQQFTHDPQRVLLALLQANFMSLQVNPPTFSCHPETGDAVLQCAFPLAESTPETFHKFLEQGVELALEWRKTYFMPEEGTGAAAQGVPQHSFA